MLSLFFYEIHFDISIVGFTVCAFLFTLFSSVLLWMFILLFSTVMNDGFGQASKIGSISPSRRGAHIQKWRKFCVTSQIANDREKQRQYLHITAISVLFGCHLHVVCL
jgi:hypothetical protein